MEKVVLNDYRSRLQSMEQKQQIGNQKVDQLLELDNILLLMQQNPELSCQILTIPNILYLVDLIFLSPTHNSSQSRKHKYPKTAFSILTNIAEQLADLLYFKELIKSGKKYPNIIIYMIDYLESQELNDFQLGYFQKIVMYLYEIKKNTTLTVLFTQKNMNILFKHLNNRSISLLLQQVLTHDDNTIDLLEIRYIIVNRIFSMLQENNEIDSDNIQLIMTEIFVKNVYNNKDQLINMILNDSDIVDSIINYISNKQQADKMVCSQKIFYNVISYIQHIYKLKTINEHQIQEYKDIISIVQQKIVYLLQDVYEKNDQEVGIVNLSLIQLYQKINQIQVECYKTAQQREDYQKLFGFIFKFKNNSIIHKIIYQIFTETFKISNEFIDETLVTSLMLDLSGMIQTQFIDQQCNEEVDYYSDNLGLVLAIFNVFNCYSHLLENQQLYVGVKGQFAEYLNKKDIVDVIKTNKTYYDTETIKQDYKQFLQQKPKDDQQDIDEIDDTDFFQDFYKDIDQMSKEYDLKQNSSQKDLKQPPHHQHQSPEQQTALQKNETKVDIHQYRSNESDHLENYKSASNDEDREIQNSQIYLKQDTLILNQQLCTEECQDKTEDLKDQSINSQCKSDQDNSHSDKNILEQYQL